MAQNLEVVASYFNAHWPVIAAAAVSLYCAYRVFKFIKADSDMALMAARNPPPSAFLGKKVWITGASQGLGAELARQFAAHGAILILSARNKERLEKVKSELRGTYAPDHVVVLPLDLTGPYEALEAAARAADAVPGPNGKAGVQYLVHNAGASLHAVVEETEAKVIKDMLSINTVAPITLTRAALPLLLASPPARLVIVSSMAGVVPSPGQAMYSGCKEALSGYFLALAAELSQRQVTVTICHPGPIEGEEGVVRSVYTATGLSEVAREAHPSKSRMPASRVAELIVKATYHGLDVVWIAKHPVLLLGYLMQYLPTLGLAVMKLVGPSRAAAIKSGESGYSMQSLLRSSRSKAE